MIDRKGISSMLRVIAFAHCHEFEEKILSDKIRELVLKGGLKPVERKFLVKLTNSPEIEYGVIAAYSPDLSFEERDWFRRHGLDPKHDAGLVAVEAPGLTFSQREYFISESDHPEIWSRETAIRAKGLTLEERMVLAHRTREPGKTMGKIASTTEELTFEERKIFLFKSDSVPFWSERVAVYPKNLTPDQRSYFCRLLADPCQAFGKVACFSPGLSFEEILDFAKKSNNFCYWAKMILSNRRLRAEDRYRLELIVENCELYGLEYPFNRK